MPKRSKKSRNSHSSSTNSSQSSSPGSKAKRALFLGSSEERRKSKGSVATQEDTPSPLPEDLPTPVLGQKRGTRRGSLLELQGKLGVHYIEYIALFQELWGSFILYLPYRCDHVIPWEISLMLMPLSSALSPPLPPSLPLPSLDVPARKTSLPEADLAQTSKFGFMIETCIIAARQSLPLICPVHRDHPLPIRDIAPDLVRG